jgi:hypothetical protein
VSSWPKAAANTLLHPYARPRIRSSFAAIGLDRDDLEQILDLGGNNLRRSVSSVAERRISRRPVSAMINRFKRNFETGAGDVMVETLSPALLGRGACQPEVNARKAKQRGMAGLVFSYGLGI